MFKITSEYDRKLQDDALMKIKKSSDCCGDRLMVTKNESLVLNTSGLLRACAVGKTAHNNNLVTHLIWLEKGSYNDSSVFYGGVSDLVSDLLTRSCFVYYIIFIFSSICQSLQSTNSPTLSSQLFVDVTLEKDN